MHIMGSVGHKTIKLLRFFQSLKRILSLSEHEISILDHFMISFTNNLSKEKVETLKFTKT